jgi:hypothetical protein
MSHVARGSIVGTALVALACGGARAAEAHGSEPVARQPSPAGNTSAPARAPDALASLPPGEPCGDLTCLLFETAEQAFANVLAEQPLVLAIGEAHAQKGSESIASTTRRFTKQLLPLLGGRATDLVIELWVAGGKCGTQEKQVIKQQKDVGVTQAESNQSEFLTLGHASKARGIQPHVLQPSCEEYEKIAAAGAADIEIMLEMIARLTADKVEALLAQRQSLAKHGMVVAYGGALHNDIEPRPGREAWSFGPRLAQHTAGRYIELDLIVPEAIGDGPVWQALPWVAHYDRQRHGNKVALFRTAPRSYTLVFAVSGGAR